jgi:hypothetical protein
MYCKVPDTSAPTYYRAARPGLMNDSQVFSWLLNYDISTIGRDGRHRSWEFVGWKYETGGPRNGQLGFIADDIAKGERWFCGVDPQTRRYKLIHQMSPKPVFVPAKAMKRRPVFMGFFR